MFTAILALAAAAVGIIGMSFYAMAGSTCAILIVSAIAVGRALDSSRNSRTTRGDRP